MRRMWSFPCAFRACPSHAGASACSGAGRRGGRSRFRIAAALRLGLQRLRARDPDRRIRRARHAALGDRVRCDARDLHGGVLGYGLPGPGAASRDLRPDARPDRLRPHRPGDRNAGAGARHAGRRDRRRRCGPCRAGGLGAPARIAAGHAGRGGLRRRRLPAQRRDARADRRGAVAGDAALGGADQRIPRRDRRRGAALRGAAGPHHRRGVSRRLVSLPGGGRDGGSARAPAVPRAAECDLHAAIPRPGPRICSRAATAGSRATSPGSAMASRSRTSSARPRRRQVEENTDERNEERPGRAGCPDQDRLGQDRGRECRDAELGVRQGRHRPGRAVRLGRGQPSTGRPAP